MMSVGNRLKQFYRDHVLAITLWSILLIIGLGSFYQLTSGLFYCGKKAAGPEIIIWTIATIVQSALYMVAPQFSRARQYYRVSQIVALPFLAVVLIQLADVYPRPFLLVLAMLGVYSYLRYWTAKTPRKSEFDGPKGKALQVLVEGTLFVLCALLIHATLAFFVLHTKSVLLTDQWFWIIYIISTSLAYFLVRNESARLRLDTWSFPPIFLLVMILLRAKLPDMAYDSFFYKATVPIMIADWRTALTGIFDHTLVGTNFLEIVNSQIKIVDPSYSPALTGSFSFIGLWILAPALTTALMNGLPGNSRITAHAGTLLLVSLTEPLTAAGTAYQEPILSLLITASVFTGPIAWIMMASAAAVKITALFFIPFLVLWRAFTVDRIAVDALLGKCTSLFRLFILGPSSVETGLQKRPAVNRVSLAAILLSILMASLILGQQFYRNNTLTGRILAPSETFASITDPNGEMLKRIEHNPVFDAVSQRGVLTSIATTVVHMATLDKWIKPGELGFHVIPSSRLALVAILFCIVVLLSKDMRSDKKLVGAAIAFFISFAIFLGFFSQGRHMAAASACAMIVVVSTVARVLLLTDIKSSASLISTSLGFAVAFFAVGDQMVGIYINNGWECRRQLFAAPLKSEYEKLSNDVDKALSGVVQHYREMHRAEVGVVPSILCEQTVERRPYFGAHYVYAYTSTSLLKRYLEVDQTRAELLPSALLAICYENEKFVSDILPQSIRSQFKEFKRVGNVNILVSEPLLAGKSVRSLTGKGFSTLQLLFELEGPEVEILNWGPRSTSVGVPFNIQSDGHSAIWFTMTGRMLPNGVEAWVGGKAAERLVVVSEQGGGIGIPSDAYAAPGRFPVYLTHTPSRTRIDIGTFEVFPNSADIPNIKILKWGPDTTTLGQEFNKQPNGISAIWFSMTGEIYPGTVEAWFGNFKLSNAVIESDKGGAMQIPTVLLQKAGEYPVYLIHVPSQKRFEVGTFKVN
jgi:hypothetical protein